jgi:hypothetical protein
VYDAANRARRHSTGAAGSRVVAASSTLDISPHSSMASLVGIDEPVYPGAGAARHRAAVVMLCFRCRPFSAPSLGGVNVHANLLTVDAGHGVLSRARLTLHT